MMLDFEAFRKHLVPMIVKKKGPNWSAERVEGTIVKASFPYPLIPLSPYPLILTIVKAASPQFQKPLSPFIP